MYPEFSSALSESNVLPSSGPGLLSLPCSTASLPTDSFKFLVTVAHVGARVFSIPFTSLLCLRTRNEPVGVSCTLLPLTELCRINEDQKVALDLDPYVKKLLNARRRVVLVNNILQNAQVKEYPNNSESLLCFLEFSGYGSNFQGMS